MEKIRINNDVEFYYNVLRNGVAESFIGASNISVKLVNEAYGEDIPLTYTITGNVITVNTLSVNLTKCGVCRFFLSYTKGDTFTADAVPFQLVPLTADTTIQVGEPIILSGDIGVNKDGASAYEVWEAYPGNEGKTMEEYITWIQAPANSAMDAALIAAGLANTAATNANDKAAIAVTAANDADEKATLANAATANANTARNAAIIATDLANTATGNANTATTAANSAAASAGTTTSMYNVTVSIPLSPGLYYNQTTARAAIPTASRKLGLVNTYALSASTWYTEKFIGSNVSGWTTETNWEQVPDSAKLASIETDLNESVELPLAETLNNLHGTMVAFEQLIKRMIFRSLQIDNLDVVKNLTIHGSTNLFLTGVTAPVNLPDFAGQYYIDTANRVGYMALSESVWLKIADAVEVAANSADMISIKNNQEPAMAEIINHLNARILALESIIKNGLFKNTQIDTADIVKSLNLYGGTNLILIRTVAPAEVPDFIGQTYVNTAAGVAYEAVGTTSVSHWKQKTN